jgi:hypothetical protein
MKKTLLVIVSLGLMIIWVTPALAAGYAWNNHASPFNYLFGNEIDTHQQSKSVGQGRLQGFLYIHYTGETINGIPVAEHTDCNSMPDACLVGWTFQGVKLDAQVMTADMFPSFCTDAQTLARLPGYSHFHWIGDPMMGMDLVAGQVVTGYLMRMVAQTTFYFRHHDTLTLVTPGVDTVSHANIQACNP